MPTYHHHHRLQVELGVGVEQLIDLEEGAEEVRLDLVEEEVGVVPRAQLIFLLAEEEVVVEERTVRMKLVLVELKEVEERVYDDLSELEVELSVSEGQSDD